MKELVALLAICLMTTVVKGYVYSYPDAISINGQDGEIDYPVGDGPAPPADMQSVGIIAALEAAPTFGLGTTPLSDGGAVLPADFERSPAIGGVVVESTVVFPNVTNAAPLSIGDSIGPNSLWSDGGTVGGYMRISPIGDPAFLSPQGAYVGIDFPDANNQIHYGWLLVRYDQPAGTYFGTIELMEAAYETDPGVPITIAPEPAMCGLGIAALVCARLGRRRRAT